MLPRVSYVTRLSRRNRYYFLVEEMEIIAERQLSYCIKRIPMIPVFDIRRLTLAASRAICLRYFLVHEATNSSIATSDCNEYECDNIRRFFA